MFLISGLRPTVDGYITIFQADLAGNKRKIELRYEMDIITFKILLKLQINVIAHLPKQLISWKNHNHGLNRSEGRYHINIPI